MVPSAETGPLSEVVHPIFNSVAEAVETVADTVAPALGACRCDVADRIAADAGPVAIEHHYRLAPEH